MTLGGTRSVSTLRPLGPVRGRRNLELSITLTIRRCPSFPEMF